jgi:hypothetical protein
MATRAFGLPTLRWLFLPLIPAAAFLGVIATAVVIRDPYLALYMGGPALLATAVFYLALQVKRFEIDEEGVTIRAPFKRSVILKVPFSRIDLSVLRSRWPYKYGYVLMYAIREKTTEYGPVIYMHMLGELDLRGLARDDIDWVTKHPGLKVEDDANPEASDANREALFELFESRMRAVRNEHESSSWPASSLPNPSLERTREK